MRTALWAILDQGVPEVQGRVFETGAAVSNADNLPMKKPFITITEGVESMNQAWSDVSTVVEVRVYEERNSSFRDVDALKAKVIDLLANRRINDGEEVWLFDYQGSVGADIVDDSWDAIGKGMRFQAFNMGWLQPGNSVLPLMTALEGWSTTEFPVLQTDPETWNPSDPNPAVYWRTQSINVTQLFNYGAEIDVETRGHVLAPLPKTRRDWTERVVIGLAFTKMLLKPNQDSASPMWFQRISADTDNDPMRE